MKKTETCPYCGHRTTLYSHKLNKQLCNALIQTAEVILQVKRPLKLQQDLDLTVNAYNNYQKLQYFGLVMRTLEGWVITKFGMQFVMGEVLCPEKAYTFGKHNYEIPAGSVSYCYIRQITDTGRKNREEYQKEKGIKFALFDDEYLNSLNFII